jgi:hypothetical protein
MLDFPVAPPILVKDTPRPRRIETLGEARVLADDLLRERRLAPLRDIKEKLDGARHADDAIEAIGALRELLALEDLIAEPIVGFERSK